MPDRSQVLTTTDLATLAALSAAKHEPSAMYAAVDAVVQKVIGHKLFSIMRVHESTNEVERLYSSNVAAYPVGGRKVKGDTPWGRLVLDEGKVFIAPTKAAVQEAFADYELIFSLGLGSCMNVPISIRGRRLGTMNILHEANWFRDQDAAAGRLIAALLVPELLAD